MGSTKKMKATPQNGFTTIRLRVVKVRGPEERLPDSITIAACGKFDMMRVDDPQWCVFNLSSPDDVILFQTAFGEVSCRCRDIEGRKRLDLGKGLAILIEGYWIVTQPERAVIASQIPAVVSQSRHCQIAFMSTRGSDDYKLPASEFRVVNSEEGWIGNFGDGATRGDVLRNLDMGTGPVANALKWILEKDAELEAKQAVLEREQTLSGRQLYVPSEKGRIRWDPSTTAMPPDSAPLASTIRAVDLSANLSSAYMF